ncbi:putative small nucleolar ribonucleoprotein complex subunit utp14 [Diaporthe ampelina]|uniref:Putative small nucleolar ribonucleoprotein complex subunit utp14 n=1 Tax=Diaporthe ampelina TaxID=1214573 RepID=A0A0G2FUA5_9PEZI|nr:putative small nucleolar ribonucleoprotein complex subunit utp14 [Diaporthe ampelina]
MTRRGRDLELDPEKVARGGKHRREEDDEADEEDEDGGPRKKRPRPATADDDDHSESDGEEVDGGSDSEGHEWHVGINSEDDDSEIESDEAFGESDDEKFDGYAFGGGQVQKKKKRDESSEDADADAGDDGESLGSDAIDLADALVQSSDDDDEEGSQGDTESGSDEEDSESDTDVDDEDSEDAESDDDEVDPAKRIELDKLLKRYADTDKEDTKADSGPRSNQGTSLQDLGVSEIRNPDIKRSVRRVKKEERAEAGKKGTSKKLDVPLARRRQDQLDRIAAYEETNKTLDRWNDTVKENRRADHLMFPLPDTLADAGLDNGELLPLTKKTAGTELEQAIMSIMEESGLGSAPQAQKEQEKKVGTNGEEQTISRSELKDLWAQRRKDRELQSREQKRAKRIKKIKSKTYRRVHRKERLGEEAKLHEEMKASGEIDSEDEREAAARRRALERVGAKHKNSKWAKMGSKVGRAAWDDDYRAGLTDMARRDEELRRRVEGRTGDSEDDEDNSDATSSSGDENGNFRLLKELDQDDEDEDEGPHASLMKLKFMQRAEAARKQENDGLVAEIRRGLGSGSEPEDEDDAEVQVGRRSYGLPEQKKRLLREAKYSVASSAKEKSSKGGLSNTNIHTSSAADTNDASSALGGQGAWSSGKSAVAERKKKKITGDRPEYDLELHDATLISQLPKPSKTKTKAASKAAIEGLSSTLQAGDDSSDDEIHHPLAVRDLDLANRAFAGDEVVAEFEAEKDAIMSEDDEKIVDKTMPGWGSWAGEGISKRALKRNKGKVLTKKEGIKKKDRKDAKLERVIINEKRNRKNEKFLASQLPHPFESRQQYERSLRLPVGPEWMTKESFQASTKPRVIVKQGIIAPMAKPSI